MAEAFESCVPDILVSMSLSADKVRDRVPIEVSLNSRWSPSAYGVTENVLEPLSYRRYLSY